MTPEPSPTPEPVPLSVGQISARPAGVAEGERWIAVNLSTQTLVAYDGDTAVFTTVIATVLPGWDTNDTRGGQGPHYDVVFSRPGIAELSARRLWERWRTR